MSEPDDDEAPIEPTTDSGRLEAKLRAVEEASVGADELTLERIRTGTKLIGLRLGPYRIREEIARGGVGVLFRAEYEGKQASTRSAIPEEVALKVVLLRKRKDKARTDAERIVREIRTLIRLRHPHVVRIYDAGRLAGLHYYTMELVRGLSVRQRILGGARMPLVMALEVAGHLASALAALHARGLLHRDVKPDNVLLDRRASPFRPVLIDFGLISTWGDEGASREVGGTPAYMAPEQTSASGKYGELGPWSDVYGVGAVLYFMVTSRPPFVGLKAENVLRAVRSDAPRPPSEVVRGLPSAVDRVIARAMAKDPGERPESAEALARELEALVEAFRRSIRAGEWWQRLRRLARRR